MSTPSTPSTHTSMNRSVWVCVLHSQIFEAQGAHTLFLSHSMNGQAVMVQAGRLAIVQRLADEILGGLSNRFSRQPSARRGVQKFEEGLQRAALSPGELDLKDPHLRGPCKNASRLGFSIGFDCIPSDLPSFWYESRLVLWHPSVLQEAFEGTGEE